MQLTHDAKAFTAVCCCCASLKNNSAFLLARCESSRCKDGASFFVARRLLGPRSVRYPDRELPPAAASYGRRHVEFIVAAEVVESDSDDGV